jgi:hypothetical protein
MTRVVRDSSAWAQADRRVTTASWGAAAVCVGADGAGGSTSWAVGIQPGYPSADFGLGWPGRATRDQDPRSSMTSTGWPNRAWLSTRPLRSRRPAVVNPRNHPAGSAGAPMARESRGRGDSGAVQRVATDTATRASVAVDPTVAEPAAGVTTDVAAMAAASDPTMVALSREVMGGTLGRRSPIPLQREERSPAGG